MKVSVKSVVYFTTVGASDHQRALRVLEPEASDGRSCYGVAHRGEGEVFDRVVETLPPCFRDFQVTPSTVTFYGKIEGVKLGAAMLSLPEESSAEDGLQIHVLLDRLCEFAGAEPETLLRARPPGFAPETLWGSTYHMGYVRESDDLAPLVELLADA